MPSGGNHSPPPPPPPLPAAAASDEEEGDDAEAEDAAQPARSPAPQTQQRFDELCSRLNMDEAARAEAWDSYRNMSESYTLEVRPGGGEQRLSGPSGPAPPRGMGPLVSPGRAPCGGGGGGTPPPRPAPALWVPSLERGGNPLCAPSSWKPGF